MDKVLAYGCGTYFLAHQSLFENTKIVAYCYTHYYDVFDEANVFTQKAPIITIDQLTNYEFDYLIICTTGESAKQILSLLVKNNFISLDKIKTINHDPCSEENKLLRRLNTLDSFKDSEALKNGNRFLFLSLLETQDMLLNVNKRLELLERKIDVGLSDKVNKNKIVNARIFDLDLKFRDRFLSVTVPFVEKELNHNNYFDLSKYNFKPGDVVIDIGANVGVVSIYLAKKYPFLKIFAFEPSKVNYGNFLYNIKLNNVKSDCLNAFNLAVTGNGRLVRMHERRYNSGCATVDSGLFDTNDSNDESLIKSITLAEIFSKFNLSKVKLLKIDCEGSEYEIFDKSTESLLSKIDAIACELHWTDQTGDAKPYNLLQYLKKHVPLVSSKISKNSIDPD